MVLDLLNNWVSQAIIYITEKGSSFFENISLLNLELWQIVLDIFVVAVIFYYLVRLVKGTRAMHIITGLVIIAIIYLISQILDLFALKWLLDRFLTLLIVAIPIIFQQELRRGLEKLGQTRLFKAKRKQKLDLMINEVVAASLFVRRMKKGALIVFEGNDSLNEYVDTGVQLNSEISKELLESIFMDKSPLHDGAVIIKNEKLLAASCVLPQTLKKYSENFGTRHKAAVGLAALTDALVIVVSEEKKEISMAIKGKIRQVDGETLKELLKKYLVSIMRKT